MNKNYSKEQIKNELHTLYKENNVDPNNLMARLSLSYIEHGDKEHMIDANAMIQCVFGMSEINPRSKNAIAIMKKINNFIKSL